MKRLLLGTAALLALAGCAKTDDTASTTTADFNTLKKEVLADFTTNVAVAGYTDLATAADGFNTAVTALNTAPNDANLKAAQGSWKAMRAVWEQCEGFLFGPVEDNSYDPNMDTWPTDYSQMDSLLASGNPLQVADIRAVTLSLRGYHPLEYLLFGNHGDRDATKLTARQRQYMLSLTADLKETCEGLKTSWTAAPEAYAQQVRTAGAGSAAFPKYQDAYLAIVGGMVDICTEVGEGKIAEPFAAKDPGIVESPYSGNSWADFRNNILGLQNVYLGRYKADGRGLNDLVAARSKDLDNRIQAAIGEALGSFNTVNGYFEDALQDGARRPQIQGVMNKLAALKTILEDELDPFIRTNILD